MSSNPALDVLLDLNGENLELDNGYWIKIEARLVDTSRAIPHGIRYSLTLHELDGKRILGYDNAHAIKPPNHGVPYAFTSVAQLLDDFWADVNRILREVRE
jgi:hypothetical protein